MGQVRIPKFELQLPIIGKDGVECYGCNSFKEAQDIIEKNWNRLNLHNDYINLWGNNGAGKRIIESKGADYLVYRIESKKFIPAFILIVH